MDLMEKHGHQAERSGKLDSNFRTASWEAVIKADNQSNLCCNVYSTLVHSSSRLKINPLIPQNYNNI